MNMTAAPEVVNKTSFSVYFDDVKHISDEEYFNGNQFSIDAFGKKYQAFPGETYIESIWRVAQSIASVEETDELRTYWSQRWFDEIYNDWWQPAGSIMQGAGSGKKISLANCTTIGLGVRDDVNDWDNLESIVKNAGYTVAKTAAYRQGLGVDFSRLRPRGTVVRNSAAESTGAVHWMEWIDKIGYFVGQKGRIPAMLFSLSIEHPDVEEFIKVKSDYTRIQNANISVQITDDFYRAVLADEEWETKFIIPRVSKGDKIYVDSHSSTIDTLKDDRGFYYIATHDQDEEILTRKYRAKELLEMIAKNMTNNAEPGIQNIDIARKYSNSDWVYDSNYGYDSRILSTNACSEQYLSRESLCVLSSINWGKFSIDFGEIRQQLKQISYSVNRFLDNVNEYELQNNTYATPHQRMAIKALRRTGAGFTNLGEWFLRKGVLYGSKEGNEYAEKLMDLYNYFLYESSIELGREKGSFELFNREKLIQSPFIQRMINKYPELKFDALRNVTVSSIAPTGTLSLMFRNSVLSYGIEPAFGIYYWKRTRISGKYEYYFCVPHVVRQIYSDAGFPIPMNSDTIKDSWDGEFGNPIVEWIEKYKEQVGINFKPAVEVSPHDKMDLMSSVMKWCDSSISVTYLLPEGSEWKDTYQFILDGWKKGVKSIAAYPDRKMYGIVSFISFKSLAQKLISEGVGIHHQNFSPEEQEILNLVRDEEKIVAGNAPKRPQNLPADIYVVTAKGEKYVLCVGLLNGAPYEMFGGRIPEDSDFDFKFKHREGILTKVSKGKYKLLISDSITIEDFGQIFKPVEQLLFRNLSTQLRHGVPIKFIVEQWSKGAHDDNFGIGSLPIVVVRTLKRYIKDGESSGKICHCGKGAEIIYQDGCETCTQCEWSKCL